jgi:Tol biopolymer transport system component
VRSGSERLGEFGPAWSPDGKEIAFQLVSVTSKTSNQVWSVIGVNVESGATRTLTAQQWEGCGRIAWLGDGRGLVLIGTKLGEGLTTARDQVWYVSQPDGAVRRVTTELNRHSYYCLGVTNDGQALLVLPYHATSQIWSVLPDGQGGQVRYGAHTAVQLTTGTAEGGAGLESLDKGRIVYIAPTGDHRALWQMDLAGRQPKQLTTDPPFLEEVAAPADGRYFVFSSNRAGSNHLFRVERDGTNLRQLTEGESIEIDSDCSADGHWIVYASQPIVPGKIEKYKLWKIPAAGGAPLQLTEHEADTPHFSPDGRWIAYIYYLTDLRRFKLAVISANGGAPVKTFDPLDSARLNVGCRWTPDSQALTYIVTKKYVSNLWAQPLSGGGPYQLTNFNSGMIYRNNHFILG